MKRNTHSVAVAGLSPSVRTKRHHMGPAGAEKQDQQGIGTVGITSAAPVSLLIL